MAGPTTQSDLWLYIYQHFGLRLPWRSFTKGHSSPFAFVWDAYCNTGQQLAAWANRSGLKTLCASIIAALEYRFSDADLQSRVLSGSEDQAKNLYRYWEGWCYRVLSDRIKGEPGRHLTRLDNGQMEILAASAKRVRGGKVQRLYRDEEDEIDPEISAASVGMLATINDTPARTIVTSTWHNPTGPMGQLVADADAKGFRLHKWNVWESIQRCEPDRHDNGRNCEACPLGKYCLKKAREFKPMAKVGIAAEGGGLLAIEDTIKQAREWSDAQWDAEAECKRPSLTGLVYPQFDRTKHVDGVKAQYDPRLPTYRAIDWGLNNFVCLTVQLQGIEVRVIDEFWPEQTTVYEIAEKLKARHKVWVVKATYCDPAGRNRNDQTGYSDVDVFNGAGIPCRYRVDRWATEVHNGIQLIRAALEPGIGPSRLFVSPECKRLIKAFEGYRLRKLNDQWIDEPQKPQEPHEHPMDALRYFFVNRMSAPTAQVRTMGYA